MNATNASSCPLVAKEERDYYPPVPRCPAGCCLLHAASRSSSRRPACQADAMRCDAMGPSPFSRNAIGPPSTPKPLAQTKTPKSSPKVAFGLAPGYGKASILCRRRQQSGTVALLLPLRSTVPLPLCRGGRCVRDLPDFNFLLPFRPSSPTDPHNRAYPSSGLQDTSR